MPQKNLLGMTDKEQKGLIYGSLIAAGMNAATGNDLRESIVNFAKGGATAYAGGVNALFDYKKEIMEQKRREQLMQSGIEQNQRMNEMLQLQKEKYNQEQNLQKTILKGRGAIANQLMSQIPDTTTEDIIPYLQRIGLSGIPGKNLPSTPEGVNIFQEYLNQNPQTSHPNLSGQIAKSALQEYAINPDSKFSPADIMKLIDPVDKYVTLGEGQMLINPKTREVIAQGNPKDKDFKKTPLGIDPVDGRMVFNDNGNPVYVDEKPYTRNMQLKPVTQAPPPPASNIFIGYDSEGNPLVMNSKGSPKLSTVEGVPEGGITPRNTPKSSIITKIVDKFNADPTVRKTQQMDEFANIIIDVSKSNNPVAHASLPTLMARASSEVGNLSEADKAPFGGSKALFARIEQTFTELYSGKRTPQNLNFIRDLAETFRNSGIRKRSEMAKTRAKQYAEANKNIGLKEQEILFALDPDALIETVPTGTPDKTNLRKKYDY